MFKSINVFPNKFFYFLFGSIFIFFSTGKWALPIAIWITIFCFIRFSKYNKIWSGFLAILAASFLSNIFVWEQIIPLPSPIYYIVCFVIALFFSFPFLLNRLCNDDKWFPQTLIFPSLFTLFSYLLTLISPSGALVSIGNTQNNIVIIQIASIFGLWGIIFLIAWTSNILNYLVEHYNDKQCIKNILKYYLPVIFLIILYGVISINIADVDTIQIAGIINSNEHIEPYEKTLEAIQNGSEIVIWQENAYSVKISEEQMLIKKYQKISDSYDVYIGLSIFSIPSVYPGEPGEVKVIWIVPHSNESFEYIKAYPTSENIARGDRKPIVIPTSFGKLSSVICFDLDFPDYIREYSKEGVNILCVPAKDWKEITPYHATISRFRAIENGFNIFRVTGNGLSVAYDYNGNLISEQNYFLSNERIFYAEVPTNKKETLFTLFGNILPFICIINIALIIVITVLKKSKRRDIPKV